MGKCLLCPNEYTGMLVPEDWQALDIYNGPDGEIEKVEICPSHEDIKKLAEVGNHTIRHARWDSQSNPKFRAVVLRQDDSLVPHDVPIFILVATDELMAPTVRHYAMLKTRLTTPEETAELLEIADEAQKAFARLNEKAK